MNFRVVLIFVFIFLGGLTASECSFAQQNANADALAAARKRAIDSTRQAQKQYFDSLRIARQKTTDSIKIARQHITDSLASLRKYRESKQYRDSVAQARQEKLDLMQASRKAYFDSIKAVRQKGMDSTLASRKTATDQLKLSQKKRTDSLAAIRSYRESKRYQDSVAVARKEKMDSVRVARKVVSDGLAADRKRVNDSLAAIRKAQSDSITAVRTKYMDSVKLVRKGRTDSLAKVKARRDNTQKVRAKEKEQKMQLALELKIKKKREAWSNEKMLNKKWSIPRQAVQNMFTRYNYYFNADKKMDEALENMQRMRKENYDSLIALFPFDPDRDSTALAPDMDSIIQKASVGIQIHDPRTKWGDDLYLLLGQAYYYKGDYDNAATAFRYIISLRDKKKKPSSSSDRSSKSGSSKSKAPSIAEAEDKSMLDFIKHKSVHNEALLWLARTYTEWHQEGNAESVLDLLETDPNFPPTLKGRLAVERAYVSLGQKDYKAATGYLNTVAKDPELPDWIRMRAAYMNGQLLQDQGNYIASADNFEQVLDLTPKIDMDFYARKNLAYSKMLAGGNQEDALVSMKKVLNDGKYAPYYEQVYYVMGGLAAKSGNTKDAVEYLQKSLGSTKSTRKQKALSHAMLGNVFYDMHFYTAAKKSYDSAARLAAAAPNDSLIGVAIKRSAVLSDVTTPLSIISTQDSLLTLAAMSEREQRSAIRKYIRYLADMKSDSAFRAENAGLNSAMQNAGDMNGQGGNYANWYFANAALMQQGQNEFKRKWGTRPLVDNWRRSSAVSMISNKTNGGQATEDVASGEDGMEYDENGLPTEESLLAFIPKTSDKQDAARKRLRRAYVDLGTAYIKQLEDYEQAVGTLDTLDRRFANHEHKAEVAYLRYLAAIKQNQMAAAQGYADHLLQKYNDTKWADLVRPKGETSGLLAMNGSVANYYDETYSLLMQRQYPQVLQRVQDGQRKYTEPSYLKRFRIMEAIAWVGTGDYNRADTLITDFMSKNPSDSLRNWAEAVLQYIKKNRPVTPPAASATPIAVSNSGKAAGSNIPSGAQPAGTVPSGKEGAKSVVEEVMAESASVKKVEPSSTLVAPAEFAYKPKEEHYVLFYFTAMEPRAMGVKAGIVDFNTFKFSGQNLTSKEEMIRADQGFVVTRSFPGMAQAKIYTNSLKGTSALFREYKSGEYQILMISASNYLKVLADKDIQPYLKFYKANYK